MSELNINSICHWCGVGQNTPTVFMGLILDNEGYLFEITICQYHFHKYFDNDYNKLIKNIKSIRSED